MFNPFKDLSMDLDRMDLSPYQPTPVSASSAPPPPPPLHPNSENAKLRRNKDEKQCAVCGDKALGYNFDAISCESCKAFFRRNAPKGLDYFRCAYEERCQIDFSNRRFCKGCRLKKCFLVGMRKEYILTDEEKAMKRQKIEENRSCKKMPSSSSSVASPSTSVAWMHEPENTNSSSSTYACRGSVAMASDGPQSQTVALSLDDTNAILELISAYRKSLEINTETDLPRHHANFSDLVNIAELSVRRVIAMAKLLSAFRAVPQPDQIQLLKGGSIELLILRSVLTFDKDKQHFLDPSDHEESKAMKMEQLEAAESGTGLFEHHMKFVRSLAFDLRADEVTLILLLVISLFSPDRDNLVHKELVAVEQEKYSLLLKKYLESVYAADAAAAIFPKLLIKLSDIRNLNEQHSQVLLRVNPQGIQPLMKEVLDLSY